MANEFVTSNPVMTEEQMAIFEKECLWNDGWWNGRKNGYRQGTRSGLIVGILTGAVAATTAIVATWMYKCNKTYRIDITDVSEKKEDDNNAEG